MCRRECFQELWFFFTRDSLRQSPFATPLGPITVYDKRDPFSSIDHMLYATLFSKAAKNLSGSACGGNFHRPKRTTLVDKLAILVHVLQQWQPGRG